VIVVMLARGGGAYADVRIVMKRLRQKGPAMKISAVTGCSIAVASVRKLNTSGKRSRFGYALPAGLPFSMR
jgi:hypothetical protein